MAAGSFDTCNRDAKCKMSPTFFSEGGFMAEGTACPLPDRPRDWYVWHFTHIDNLPGIVATGSLWSANEVVPSVDVADPGVKARRRKQVVQPDAGYPRGRFVSDHVPFYIAAKSPMLYVVARGHAGYHQGTKPLVFLGVKVGDLVDSGVIWCASDRNAAAGLVAFSREVDELGSFVDFELLGEKYWNATVDDPDRKTRRSAEVLVLDSLPLSLVSAVVAESETRLEMARSAMAAVNGTRRYWVIPEFYS